MEDKKPFKSISELINEIKQYTHRLEDGSLSVGELSNVLSATLKTFDNSPTDKLPSSRR